MLDKFFKKKSTETPANQKAEEKEYTRYAIEVERTLTKLEARLHNGDDPEEITKMALKTACEFYQGDWAGLLEVDMDLNIWTPFWWYNPHPNDLTGDEYATLVKYLKDSPELPPRELFDENIPL